MANFFSFLKEARAELEKVSWPTKTLALRLTILVIAVTVTMAIYLGTLDYLFAKLVKIVLGGGKR